MGRGRRSHAKRDCESKVRILSREGKQGQRAVCAGKVEDLVRSERGWGAGALTSGCRSPDLASAIYVLTLCLQGDAGLLKGKIHPLPFLQAVTRAEVDMGEEPSELTMGLLSEGSPSGLA